MPTTDGFPSIESPLVTMGPAGGRVTQAWYRFFVTLWTGGPTGQRMTGEMVFWSDALAAPSGWLLCNGANVSRTVYATLFALIGTHYGPGDGVTTFGLPNIAFSGSIFIIKT